MRIITLIFVLALFNLNHASAGQVKDLIKKFQIHSENKPVPTTTQGSQTPLPNRTEAKVNVVNLSKNKEFLANTILEESKKLVTSPDQIKKRITYYNNFSTISEACIGKPNSHLMNSLSASGNYLKVKPEAAREGFEGDTFVQLNAQKLVVELFEQAWLDIRLARMGLLRSPTEKEGLSAAVHRLDLLFDLYRSCLEKSMSEASKLTILNQKRLEDLVSDDIDINNFKKLLTTGECTYPAAKSLIEGHLSYLENILVDKMKQEVEKIESSQPFKTPDHESANPVVFIQDSEGHTIAVKKPNVDEALYNEDPGFGVFNELFVSTFDRENGNFFGVPTSAKQGDHTHIAFKNAKPFNSICEEHASEINIVVEGTPHNSLSTGSSTPSSSSGGTAQSVSSSSSHTETPLLDRSECLSRIQKNDSQKYVAMALLFNLDDAHCGNILLSKENDHFRPISIDHGAALKASPVRTSPRFTNCLMDFPHLNAEIDPTVKTFFKNVDIDHSIALMDSKLGVLGKKINPNEYEKKLNHFRANLILMKKGIDAGLTLQQILALRVPPFKASIEGEAIPITQRQADNMDRGAVERLKLYSLNPSAWDRAWMKGTGGNPTREEFAQPLGFKQAGKFRPKAPAKKKVAFKDVSPSLKDTSSVESSGSFVVNSSSIQKNDSSVESSGSLVVNSSIPQKSTSSVESTGSFVVNPSSVQINDSSLENSGSMVERSSIKKVVPAYMQQLINKPKETPFQFSAFETALDEEINWIKKVDMNTVFSERNREIYGVFGQ